MILHPPTEPVNEQEKTEERHQNQSILPIIQFFPFFTKLFSFII
jgi:hypothetical protein